MWKNVVYKGVLTSLVVNEKGEVYNSNNDKMAKCYLHWSGYICAYIPKIRKLYRVHRMVAEAFIPNPNNYPYVNHIDGNKQNNSVNNLEWVTAKMNSIHAEKLHLVNHARGERSGSNKYPEKLIHEVCRLLEKQLPCTTIAKMTGVSRSVVKGVKFGEIWKHVFDQYNIPQVRRKCYKELNSIIDYLLRIGLSKKMILNILLEFIDSKKVAKQLYYRRKKIYDKRQKAD